VQRYLKQLQDKHYVHIPGGNQKRALQVINPSHSVLNSLQMRISASQGGSLTNPSPSQLNLLREGSSPLQPANGPQVEALSLPLLGRVAAGSPIESFMQDESVSVPSSMVRSPNKTYALIVQGQSMIEDGILDGDVVLVQRQSFANNGETVVAMINNQATIKRFYLHRSHSDNIHSNPQTHTQSAGEPIVELRPANSTMQALWYPPYHVDIQGILVGLMRRF
jgi:repressor LexA